VFIIENNVHLFRVSYAPINAIGVTAFESCTTEIGNVLVFGERSTDIIKNYLELFMNHSRDAKNTWLAESAIYFEDTPNQFDDFKAASENVGFMKRKGIFAAGRVVKTMAKLPFPLSQTGLLLIPDVDLTFSLKKGNNTMFPILCIFCMRKLF